MKAHVCKELDYCVCGPLAEEPNDDCPIHAIGPWPPRCMICGKFLPYSIRESEPEQS